MTATTFSNKKDNKVNVGGSYTTAEIIYYQMYKLGIHHEWEKRPFNSLMTLIRVMAEKEEQAKLRRAYIDAIRGNVRAQLNNIDIVDENGKVENLGEKYGKKSK